MFERFTKKAIKVILLAREEAKRSGHDSVATEQMLLGLIGEGIGVAARVLRSAGVNLKNARIEVERTVGRGSGVVEEEIPFTPRAKELLQLSLDEADRLGHNYIGTEHLLLGLVLQRKSVAILVLENLGVSRLRLHSEILSTVRGTSETNIDNTPKSPTNEANFTEKAIKAIILAREEARRLGYDSVATEQILLGLIGEGIGVAARVLRSAGVNLKNARIEVEKLVDRGSGCVAAEIPFTPEAKKLLQFSLKEARSLGDNDIGTGHLLLGLIQEKESVAVRALENLGVVPSQLYKQTLDCLNKRTDN